MEENKIWRVSMVFFVNGDKLLATEIQNAVEAFVVQQYKLNPSAVCTGIRATYERRFERT